MMAYRQNDMKRKEKKFEKEFVQINMLRKIFNIKQARKC